MIRSTAARRDVRRLEQYCGGYAGSINRLIDGQIVIHAGWRQPL